MRIENAHKMTYDEARQKVGDVIDARGIVVLLEAAADHFAACPATAYRGLFHIYAQTLRGLAALWARAAESL